MVGVINEEQRPELKETIETNLPERQLELTASSIPPTCYKSDFEIELVSTPPPPPPPPPRRSLGSPLIISIRQKLEQARQNEASSSWETQSIYRVPKSLRDVDNTAYTPQIVSLGPYHRGRLPDMDCHKWRALNHALDRTGHNLCDYLDAARSLEDRARACYEAPLSISSDDFVESLVLDSIFILELFRGFEDEGFQNLGYVAKDPVFANSGGGITLSLQGDMLLLENQLPLFVLDRIHALQLGHPPSTSGLVADLAFSFFDNFRLTNEPDPSSFSLDPLSDAGSSEVLHCLDVFRRSLLLEGPKEASRPRPVNDQRRSPFIGSSKALRCLDVFRRSLLAGPKPASQLQYVDGKQRWQFIHCVAELHEAGIKFKRRKNALFWDIKFEDGILHIPRIYIQDTTKSLFRNLIAFEQCHLEGSGASSHITSYVIFMDDLINSEVDVRYLHDRGIIENFLGSDGEVADLFNQLCKGVASDFRNSYLSELSEQVNCYCDKRRNAWRAILTHKYFSNPWSIISLIAGVVLLLLTFAQTFYAIYSYHKPHS